MQVGAISPIQGAEPIRAISPIKASKKQDDEKNIDEQATQMQPAFTAPIYAYHMQPMYMMPNQPPMMMPVPVMIPQYHGLRSNMTNPIQKADKQDWQATE